MDQRQSGTTETRATGITPARLTTVLRHATEVIRAGWSHWAPALNAQNILCDPDDPDAVAFDPLSALLRVTGDFDLAHAALCFLDELAPGYSVSNWNDAPDRKHAEVVRLFEQAALRASRTAESY